jgi:hypothetical protein
MVVKGQIRSNAAQKRAILIAGTPSRGQTDTFFSKTGRKIGIPHSAPNLLYHHAIVLDPRELPRVAQEAKSYF